MSDVTEFSDNPFWGRIQRNGSEGWWWLEIRDNWGDAGMIRIRVYFEDPEDPIVQANYRKMREEWDSLWPRIVERTNQLKASYTDHNAPIDLEDDWLYIRPPKIPIEEAPEWSAMLQAEDAGWLIDFKGWEDYGGQGVF